MLCNLLHQLCIFIDAHINIHFIFKSNFDHNYPNKKLTRIIFTLRLKCGISPCTFTQFWHWSYTFFCLALVPALYKKFGIGPSVNFPFKKKKKHTLKNNNSELK